MDKKFLLKTFAIIFRTASILKLPKNPDSISKRRCKATTSSPPYLISKVFRLFRPINVNITCATVTSPKVNEQIYKKKNKKK